MTPIPRPKTPHSNRQDDTTSNNSTSSGSIFSSQPSASACSLPGQHEDAGTRVAENNRAQTLDGSRTRTSGQQNAARPVDSSHAGNASSSSTQPLRLNPAQRSPFIDDFLYSVAVIFEKTSGDNVIATAIDHIEDNASPTGSEKKITVLVARNIGFKTQPDNPLDPDHSYRIRMEKRLADFLQTHKKQDAEKQILEILAEVVGYCESSIIKHAKDPGKLGWLPSPQQFKDALDCLTKAIERQDHKPILKDLEDIKLRPVFNPSPTAKENLTELVLHAMKFQLKYGLVLHRRPGYWRVETDSSFDESLRREFRVEKEFGPNRNIATKMFDMVESISRVANAILAIAFFISENSLENISFHLLPSPTKISRECSSAHPTQMSDRCPWPAHLHWRRSTKVHCEVQIVDYYQERLDPASWKQTMTDDAEKIRVGVSKKPCLHCYYLLMGSPYPPLFKTVNGEAEYSSIFITPVNTHHNEKEPSWGVTQRVYDMALAKNNAGTEPVRRESRKLQIPSHPEWQPFRSLADKQHVKSGSVTCPTFRETWFLMQNLLASPVQANPRSNVKLDPTAPVFQPRSSYSNNRLNAGSN